MSGQSLVDERVIGRHQVEHAPVFVHDAPEKERCLLLECLSQVVVEVCELLRVRLHVPEIAQVEPLAGEIGDDRVRLGVGEHPPHLLLEDCWRVEPPPAREIQELIVGNAAPDEERQSRRELEIRYLVDRLGRRAGRIGFDVKSKLRTCQNPLKCRSNASLEVAFGSARPIEPEQALEVRVGDVPAIPAPREC